MNSFYVPLSAQLVSELLEAETLAAAATAVTAAYEGKTVTFLSEIYRENQVERNKEKANIIVVAGLGAGAGTG